MTSMPSPCSTFTISLNSRAAASGPPPSARNNSRTAGRREVGQASQQASQYMDGLVGEQVHSF